MFSIGNSVQGRPLNVYQFGDGPIRVLFIGGLHTGAEDNTRILAEMMVQYFTDHPDAIPSNVTLYILPSVNPDGSANASHNNANGVDLNRNWPSANWRSDPYHPCCGRVMGMGGSTPLSEPETKALYDFILHERPVMSFVWHAYGALIEDNNIGIADPISERYARATGYTHIVKWTAYEINGQFIDAMAEMGVAAADIELATSTNPHFDTNLQGVLAVLEYLRTYIP